MRSAIWLPVGIAIAVTATANEVTVKNDSLVDGSTGVIVSGFASGEAAASWLTSPCSGNVVAAQIFWRSQNGGAAQAIEDSIIVYRAGSFPDPGGVAAEIAGPVLTDGVINEYRYLDENNTIPLIVPVVQGETFVVSLTFFDPPPAIGPSVVRDNDDITPLANALYGDIGQGLQWYDADVDIGITGDWVIRAVVDCQSVGTDADVVATMSADPPQYTAGAALTYTITISNSGPAGAASTTVVDAFPADYESVTWICAADGGASCTPNGSGTIAQNVGLPAGASVVFTATGTVAAGTTGTLSNTATAVVGAPASDPDTTNNSATLDLDPAGTDDRIFANGFDLG